MRIGLISCVISCGLTAFTPFASARPVITADLANLRGGPGLDYPALTAIPPHTPLEVLRCHDKWCQVLWQGQSGYIAASLLTNSLTPGAVSPARPAAVYLTPPPYPYESYDNGPYGTEYSELYGGGFYDDGWYAGSWGHNQGPGFWGSGGWAGPSFRGPGLWGRGLWGRGFHNGGLRGGRAHR